MKSEFEGIAATRLIITCIAFWMIASSALASGTSSSFRGNEALYKILQDLFRSPVVTAAVKERLKLGEKYLGRPLRDRRDFLELAKVLSAEERSAEGNAVARKLQKIRAKGEFEGKSPQVVKMDVSAEKSPVDPALEKAIAQEFLRPISTKEFNETVDFLAKDRKKTRAEILEELRENHLVLQEVIARSEGWRPDTGSMVGNFLDRVKWEYQNRKLVDPNFMKLLARLLAWELLWTWVSERAARGPLYWAQIDYVAADFITFTLTEIVLGWFSSSTMTSKLSMRTSIPKPDSIFEKGLTLKERAIVFGERAKLIGPTCFSLALVGNGSVELYHAIKDSDQKDAPKLSDRMVKVIWNAFLTGTFFGLSSNFRYSLLTWASRLVGPKLGSIHVLLKEAYDFASINGNDLFGSYTYVLYANSTTDFVDELAKKWGINLPIHLPKGEAKEVKKK